MELLIGQGADVAGFAFPDDGGFIFAGGRDMAVETVVGDVELSADKPFGPGSVPFQDLVPFFEPVEFVGDSGPEFFGVFDGFAVDAFVFFQALDVGLLAEGLGAFELPVLVEDGVNISASICRGGLVRHAGSSVFS